MSGTIVILGPTCAWKSAAALAIAAERSGEIVSCDSMQVYRALPIGTAQPSAAEQLRIRHHLVGCLELQDPWDANRFVPAAHACIAEIAARGHQAIVVGGTGLYARALCYALHLLPSDPELAAQLRRAIATSEGCEALRAELSDGVRGELPADIRLNPRHLARAVEVFRLTGQAPWLLQDHPTAPLPEFRQFCILPPFDFLKERIRERTRAMLAAGWVRECQEAVANGLLQSPTARQALGYRDIVQFLTAGSPGGDSALAELLANRTIQYARRQLTWFKHQHPGAVVIPVTDLRNPLTQIVEAIRKTLGD